MLLASLIDQNLPTLKPTDTVGDALHFMSEEKIGQLVMVSNKDIHIFEENALLNFDDQLALSLVPATHLQIFLSEEIHLIEAVSFVLNLDLEVCPVLDLNGEYLGSAKAIDLYKTVLRNQFKGDGSVISLKVNYNDYSLAEISRIVEMEGVRIERLYLDDKSDLEYQFIIKFNKKDSIRAVKSLIRFGYKVEKITENDFDGNIDKDRFGLLMKYLEI